MRVVFFGNNRVGLEVLRWLLARDDDIVAAVVHPADNARLASDIAATAAARGARIIEAPSLRDARTVAEIRDLRPDIGLSAYFGYILRKELIEVFPRGCLNVHPGFLPYNRGTYPNVWSIVDGTPAGATLHYIDEGVDTGDIVEQREVPIESVDTGARLYGKLERACIDLVADTWPRVVEGRASRRPQPDCGTAHRRADVDRLDRLELDRQYSGRQLLDLLRARTFPPHRGAYFDAEGRRVYVRIELSYEDELIAAPVASERESPR